MLFNCISCMTPLANGISLMMQTKTEFDESVMRLESNQRAELQFWAEEIKNYVDWYQGRKRNLYRTLAPAEADKVQAGQLHVSALVTWAKLHQRPKYLHDLQLGKDAFRGLKVLDVGSGPIPSATCFEGADIYALDPLAEFYESIGYSRTPFPNVHYCEANAEKMPFSSHFFDVVLSVNAIDHVDDFEQAAAEIIRVLKPGGKLAMHVHYHPATECEPLELNDRRVRAAFSAVHGFAPVHRSQCSFTNDVLPPEEFVLWRNF